METTEAMANAADTYHVFEAAGLGKAPFRFVGIEIKLHCVPGGVPRAGSSCDFCGTAIAQCCWIRSADGRSFKVGSDCVYKSDDAGLVSRAKQAVDKANREAKAIRDRARIEAARAALAREDVRATLASKPHPQEWASKQGRTLLDWADWMIVKAGTAGRIKVARAVGC